MPFSHSSHAYLFIYLNDSPSSFYSLVSFYERSGPCSGSGLVALWQCGVLPDQGSNLRALQWGAGWTPREVPQGLSVKCFHSSALRRSSGNRRCSSLLPHAPSGALKTTLTRARTAEPLSRACPASTSLSAHLCTSERSGLAPDLFLRPRVLLRRSYAKIQHPSAGDFQQTRSLPKVLTHPHLTSLPGYLMASRTSHKQISPSCFSKWHHSPSFGPSRKSPKGLP